MNADLLDRGITENTWGHERAGLRFKREKLS
jgi:hypothetical protein